MEGVRPLLEGVMMEQITPIKNLRPRMRFVNIQGTVVQVTPIKQRLAGSGQRHWDTASFILQDDTGRIRVTLLGNACTYMRPGLVTVGRQVKLLYLSVRKGTDGQPEIVVRIGGTHVEGIPTAEEEEYMRRLRNEGPIIPTRWIDRDRYPELYRAIPVTIQVPRGLFEFAQARAAREGIPVETLFARMLDREFEWEFHPPNQ